MKTEDQKHNPPMQVIDLTQLQKEQFNRMRRVLRQITENYMTPDQLRSKSENDYGLEYEESLEMAYENIQSLAAYAVRGVKEIKS